MKTMDWMRRWLLVVAVLLIASVAQSAVRREGTWPEQDKSVTLDLTAVTRAEAVRKVADAAGWSVVFKGLPEDRIDVHVKNQPASRVLDIVLSDSSYIARRDGDILQIQHDDGTATSDAVAAPPPALSAAPAPTDSSSSSSQKKKNKHKNKHKEDGDPDRTVFGGDVRVEKDETVDDISVFGGSVDILGTATGGVTVFGGSVHIYPGAHVEGDLAVIGGEAQIDDDATVDGDVVALGGELKRGGNAKIGGEVQVLGDDDDDHDKHHASRSDWEPTEIFRLSTIGKQMTKTAFLFLIGAVVIAIATRRMQLLQSEIALRPMRSMAVGIASLVIGAILAVLLCVTIVGIPVAIVGLLIAILAAYAGICATLSAMGSAIVAHRSENPYVHLAVGCAVFLVVGFIPYFGSLVTLLVLIAGFGAFAATRAAGFIPVNR